MKINKNLSKIFKKKAVQQKLLTNWKIQIKATSWTPREITIYKIKDSIFKAKKKMMGVLQKINQDR